MAEREDKAPGDPHAGEQPATRGVRGYAIGLALAILLTVASFAAAGSHIIYGPAIPAALIALAVAQMGVHLVFFLHISTGEDNLNNVLALAFGVLIVVLFVGGSLWIMAHLNHMAMPMDAVMRMQR